MSWLEEIDKDLYALRCKENGVYYCQDTGKTLDREELRRISETRQELLSQPGLMSKVSGTKKNEDSLMRRKAELLEREIVSLTIQCDPILLEIENEIDERQHRFDSSSVYRTLVHSSDQKLRKEVYLSQVSYLRSIENLFRQFVVRANAMSRRLGFADYVDAKFYTEESGLQETASLMSYALKETEGYWKDLIRDASNELGDTVEPYDLDFFTEQRLSSYAVKHFEKAETVQILTDTLSAFGVQYSDLPISVETHDLPAVGACYCLKAGEDIRLVMSPSEGYAYYRGLFHELGHALYYCFCPPDTELFTDNQIMREIMADIWKGIVESREWLERFSNLSAIELDGIMRSRQLCRALWVRPIIREYLFEAEIFKDEQQDFSDIWNRITSDVLFVPDVTGVYSDWDFSHPLDIKNYVLAVFVKDTAIDYLQKQFSHIMQESVFAFLVENLYKPGNMTPYREKLQNIGWTL